MSSPTGPAGFDVAERVEDGVAVCRVQGEIDAANVDAVLTRCMDAVGAESSGLVLDLGPTVYLDSAGVRVLFELARRLRAHHQDLRIAVPPEGIVRRVLVLTALADVVPLHDGVDDALAAFRTPGRSGPRDR